MGSPSYGRDAARVAFGTSLFLAMLGICFAKKVPANFVFGDSLVDAGNNNYIMSLSKADYEPYGLDLGGPTGRFTNGRTIVDIIGKSSFNLSKILPRVSVLAGDLTVVPLLSCCRRRARIRRLHPSLLGPDDSLARDSGRCELCLGRRWDP